MAGAGDFSINGVRYRIQCEGTSVYFGEEFENCLVTVLPRPPLAIDLELWLENILEDYLSIDDVFQPPFLQVIVLTAQFEQEIVKTLLKREGTQHVRQLVDSQLSPGPYKVFGGQLHPVVRLYADTQKAFIDPKVFSSVSYVPVPSRIIQLSQNLDQGLRGVRVAVKDNFHLKGWKTSLCNQAYYDTYPTQERTAECLERLECMGAVIIGKVKMTSFAVWEEPYECVDFEAPWNPRADGYQSPGGSSSGSAAAVGAYDWVDFAIGSDTCGSIMRPALWNGCFGLRPTTGAVSTNGLVMTLDYLDVPCVAGRDLERLRRFAELWYDNDIGFSRKKKFSKFIWATDYWNTIGLDQVTLAKEFLSDLEQHFEIASEEISFEDTWNSKPPPGSEGKSLKEFILPATRAMWYDFYHAFDDFRAKHQERYEKQPEISRPIQEAWNHAAKVKSHERDDAVKRLGMYREWFESTILENEDHPVLLVPIENLTPRYRNIPEEFDRPPPGINSLFLSPILEAPELVIPVGHIPYSSKISGEREFLPFAVGLIGLRGADLMLIDETLSFLVNSNRPTVMRTGKRAFTGGKD